MDFLPIEWAVDRDGMYINIDCFVENEKGQKVPKTEICRQIIDGCNLDSLNCIPERGIKIQVFDKGGKLLAESKWEKNVKLVRVNRDNLHQIRIEIE